MRRAQSCSVSLLVALELFLNICEEFIPCVNEFFETLYFEFLYNLVVVHSGTRYRIEVFVVHFVIFRDAGIGDLPVISHGIERGFWQGIDRMLSHETIDVAHIGILWVLRACGSPQRTLQSGVGSGEQLPTFRFLSLFKDSVGKPSIGNTCTTTQLLHLVVRQLSSLELIVDFGVYTGYEEASH